MKTPENKELSKQKLQEIIQPGEDIIWQEFADTSKRPASFILCSGACIALMMVLGSSGRVPGQIVFIITVSAVIYGALLMARVRSDQLYAVTNRRVIAVDSTGKNRTCELGSTKNPTRFFGIVTIYPGWTEFSSFYLFWIKDTKSTIKLIKDLRTGMRRQLNG